MRNFKFTPRYTQSHYVLNFAWLFFNLLDVFFIAQIWFTKTTSNQLESVNYVLFMLTLSFVCVPILVSIFQLQKELKKWAHDVDSGGIIDSWLLKYFRLLFVVSIVTGSSFTAVRLLNTNLFGWRMYILIYIFLLFSVGATMWEDNCGWFFIFGTHEWRVRHNDCETHIHVCTRTNLTPV